MGIFGIGGGGGGEDQATAHIDDTVKMEEDGVTEKMEISMDLAGDSQAVEQAVKDYKMGGGGEGAPGAEGCKDCDQPPARGPKAG